jgi:hypothetical protein
MYECEFDSMCGKEFKTMDERDRHERVDHNWEQGEREDEKPSC